MTTWSRSLWNQMFMPLSGVGLLKVIGRQCLCCTERRGRTGFVLIRTHCDESVLYPRQGFGHDSSQSRGGRKRVTDILMECNDLKLPLSFTLLVIHLADIFFQSELQMRQNRSTTFLKKPTLTQTLQSAAVKHLWPNSSVIQHWLIHTLVENRVQGLQGLLLMFYRLTMVLVFCWISLTPFIRRKPSVIWLYIEEQMEEPLKVLDRRDFFLFHFFLTVKKNVSEGFFRWLIVLCLQIAQNTENCQLEETWRWKSQWKNLSTESLTRKCCVIKYKVTVGGEVW